MTRKEAWDLVGGLSEPSKMPCYGYGLPVSKCPVRPHFLHVRGSVCRHCYANTGQYMFRNVKDAQLRRWKSLDHPQWVEAMTVLCARLKHFRWHDSGELKNKKHFANIVKVAENAPGCRFWLPTKRYDLLRGLTPEDLPPNLIVRVSGVMVNAGEPDSPFPSAIVHSTPEKLHAAAASGVTPCIVNLPPYHAKTCGKCRACWDREARVIGFLYHGPSRHDVPSQ